MWRWRRMAISWPHHMRNEEVGLLHITKDRNIPHTIKKRKVIWIGHCL